MRQVFSRVKRPLSDERGNILVITSFLILGLFLMSLGLIEVGRFLIIREQVQTVGDAATLAGVGAKDSAQRWVKIDIHTEHGSFREYGEDGSSWCVGCDSTVVDNIIGLESDLIDNGGWRRYSLFSCGNCSTPYDTWYTFKDRDIIYNLSDMEEQVTKLRGSAKSARNSVTNAIDNVLKSLKSREHRAFTTMYSQVLGGISLEDKQELADNESKFTRKYVTEVRGFSKAGNLCSTEYSRWKNSYYWDIEGYRWDYDLERRYKECAAAVSSANEGHRALQSIRSIIDDSQKSISDLEEQVEGYITDTQNTVNSPDYVSGKQKSDLATRAFLEKALKAKKLEYGEGENILNN
ncbi:MAG: hypothetical protein GX333_08415 [Syntrophomonadaceae bacterium]|nr:hypothetical protein [Syntrophomonadaceae bacterium]